MKKSILFLSVCSLFLLFSSCSQRMTIGMEPVPGCWDLNVGPDNVIGTFTNEPGLLREVTVWVPADDQPVTSGEEVRNDVVTIPHSIWVILPDNHPGLMFEACNLPDAHMIENSEVFFSGNTLQMNPNVSNFEGFTPFNLTEITGGVDGPFSDHDESC